MNLSNSFKLIIAILLCQLAGIIGSLFNSFSIKTWYLSIIKPSFNPPNWLFAPVWTTLFLLMGISFYLIWKNKSKTKKAICLFIAQLTLNILWSFFFFTLRSPFLALINIIILWMLILLTMIEFKKISKPSAYLLIPYILWVSFAVILNFFILLLN
ncbi:MAG: tryptophan-rich sensory protein [Nanoarchaeota archaeon]|nr:tryptophan-rich sensory protein [Nanoarchaeota archaeon]